MSYDFYVMKLKRPVASASELGPDTVVFMGDASAVRKAIGSVISGIEWLSWGGSLQSDSGWMEFRVSSDKDAVDAFMVCTSHGSDHGWESEVLKNLCSAHQWVALDAQTDTFMYAIPKATDPEAP